MSIVNGQNADASDFWRVILETLKSASGTFAEQTVLAGTLPADKLETNRYIRVKALFSALNRASSGVDGGCTVKLYIGTTAIATIGLGNFDPTKPALLDAVIRYNGSNAQYGVMNIIGGSSTGTLSHSLASGSAAEDTSTDLNVSLTVSGAGGAYACSVASFELV